METLAITNIGAMISGSLETGLIDADTLLVTTRYKLLAIQFDGTILWEFDTLDDPVWRR